MSIKQEPIDIDSIDSGELETSHLSRRVWLVKVPKFLAEKWNDVNQDGLQLGTVRIHMGEKNEKEPKVSMHLPDIPLHQGIPKEYALKFTNNEVKNMLIFTENGQGAGVGIEGTVHHECTVTPVINDEYRKIMRQRQIDSLRPSRTVQALDEREVTKTTALRDDNAATSFDTLRKSKPTLDQRKERMPKEELIDLLFSAFEKYQYWPLKGLVDFAKQPVQYLKDTLSEIAMLHKRGTYSGMWELKPEFKRKKDEDDVKKEERDKDGDHVMGGV
ncbi:transcription initiation factor IIF, beta subunit [Paraphysoderma sedebokerense]|nr:transcription initiation factor IIF, beta subunit [Paraphysoderma sedebokerense]